jgi:hypothetical protein
MEQLTMADDKTEKIIAALKDEIRTLLWQREERVGRMRDMLMEGVGLFTAKFKRLPNRKEIDAIGEIVLEILEEQNADKPAAPPLN